MKIKGNPILGKIVSGSSLLLNDDGLFRKIKVNNYGERIFLTSDPKLICELLELDFEAMDKIDEDDAYEIIMKSPYFNHECFEKGKDMSGSSSLSKFLAYYKDYPTKKVCGEKKVIRTTYIESIVNIELRDEIDDIKRILSEPRKRLSGMTLLPFLGDYDKRNFQNHFNTLWESFDTSFQRRKFLLDTPIADIADYFKKINEIN